MQPPDPHSGADLLLPIQSSDPHSGADLYRQCSPLTFTVVLTFYCLCVTLTLTVVLIFYCQCSPPRPILWLCFVLFQDLSFFTVSGDEPVDLTDYIPYFRLLQKPSVQWQSLTLTCRWSELSVFSKLKRSRTNEIRSVACRICLSWNFVCRLSYSALFICSEENEQAQIVKEAMYCKFVECLLQTCEIFF